MTILRSLVRMAAVSAALLVAAPRATHAQVSSSVVTDLIKKGKDELNNLNYKPAADIANQVLALGMSLSRQQRIDALQLLAAAMYPEEDAEQRADSATKVIRQLVVMGVRSGVSRDISWRGLDTLYAHVVNQSPTELENVALQGSVAKMRDSVESILHLVQEGRTPDEIAGRVSVDCYSFSFTALDEGLQRLHAPASLGTSIKRTCGRVQVVTDPPNASVTIAKHEMGTAPQGGAAYWVDPAPGIDVSVWSSAYRTSKTVDVQAGKFVDARFFLPRDTLPWPVPRTATQIATDLHLFDRFTPTTPRPVQPVKPSHHSAALAGAVWGLLGGAAGYAVGQLVPSMGCVSNYTVPNGETWLVGGQRYNSGDQVNLGKGSSCTMTIAGGAGAGMFLMSSLAVAKAHRSADRRYSDAARAYPVLLQEWDKSERRAFVDRSPEVQQAMATERAQLLQVQTDNAAIVTRNAKLPDPQITIRDLRPDDDRTPSDSTKAPPR